MPSPVVIATSARSVSPSLAFDYHLRKHHTNRNAAGGAFADTAFDVAAQRHPPRNLAKALRGIIMRDREPYMLQKVEVQYK